MAKTTLRQRTQERLERATERRDALRLMSEVGFLNLPLKEAGIVGEIFQEFEQKVTDYTAELVKYGSAEFCEWMTVRNMSIRHADDTGHSFYIAYTKDQDAEGYYHWKAVVTEGTFSRVGGYLVFHGKGGEPVVKESGKAKKKRICMDKAIKREAELWQQYGTRMAQKRNKRKAE